MSDTRLTGRPFVFTATSSFQPSATVTAWNPADKGTDINLSNGFVDATDASGINQFNGVRSTAYRATGKWYIEFETMAATNTAFLVIGICYATSLMSGLFSATGDGAGMAADGTIHNNVFGVFTNPDSQNNTGGTVGSTLQVAIDMDVGKGWFGILNVWGNGGGDPATGVNPHFIWTPTGTPIYAAMSAYGIYTTICRIKPTSASQLNAPPAGFTAWG